MIKLISCERYPQDQKVIPYGSTFPIDKFRVRLITDSVPSSLNLTGADVDGLADTTEFAVGSILYVADGTDNVIRYVYIDGAFKLWDSDYEI